MRNSITLYEYDYAGYYEGKNLVVPEDDGYQPGNLTLKVPPSVGDNEYAVFDGISWRVTDKDRPDVGVPPQPPEPPEPEDVSVGPEVL